MAVPITALYAGIGALLLIALAALVVRRRRRYRVGLGHGGEIALERAIRAHGNAAEYVPLALVLLLVAELNGAAPALLHACGATLMAARLAHAWGLARHSGVSSGRTLGVAGTWGVIVTLAAVDIATSLR